jgi:hypothetical protein
VEAAVDVVARPAELDLPPEPGDVAEPGLARERPDQLLRLRRGEARELALSTAIRRSVTTTITYFARKRKAR